MSKFAGNPLLDGHLDLREMADALNKSERTILRYCEDRKDPLPHIDLPSGEKIFNITSGKKWLARRERAALPTPRRRSTAALA